MIRRLITLSVLALFVVVTASCQKLQARDNLNKGIKAFREARFEAAVEYFENASKLDPELTNAELYLATAWAQQYIPNVDTDDNKRFAQNAIKTFDQVLAKDANNTSAVAGLAGMYQSLGQYEKAKEYYMKQTQIDPENPIPYYAIGSTDWILVYDKNNPLTDEQKAPLVAEGLQYVDKALEKNPNYDEAMTYKNLLLRQKALLTKDPKEAKALEDEANIWVEKALATRKANEEKKSNPATAAEETK
jgi:tetratricopeptide (TPR) repeat protein